MLHTSTEFAVCAFESFGAFPVSLSVIWPLTQLLPLTAKQVCELHVTWSTSVNSVCFDAILCGLCYN